MHAHIKNKDFYAVDAVQKRDLLGFRIEMNVDFRKLDGILGHKKVNAVAVATFPIQCASLFGAPPRNARK